MFKTVCHIQINDKFGFSKNKTKWNLSTGTPLAVQWLELHTSIAEGPGSTPAWGTKIPHAMQYSWRKKSIGSHLSFTHTYTHTHRCWCGQGTATKAAGLPLARRQDRLFWAGPVSSPKFLKPCPVGGAAGECWPWATAPGFAHAHLWVRAIFSLSFSDLRCVSAGPAQEAFSSSVPLTLDAWVEDGVTFAAYHLSWQRQELCLWVWETQCLQPERTTQRLITRLALESPHGVQKVCAFIHKTASGAVRQKLLK